MAIISIGLLFATLQFPVGITQAEQIQDYTELSDVNSSATHFIDYSFLMSDPLCITSDDDYLYLSDELGQVLRFNSKTNFETVKNLDGSSYIIAAHDGGIYNASENAIAAFNGNYMGEIHSDAIYIVVGDVKTKIAIPYASDGVFLNGTLLNDTLYVFELSQNVISLYTYYLANNDSANLIKGTLVASRIETGNSSIQQITGTAFIGSELYYSTPYALYRLNSPTELAVTGGINSLCEFSGKLYYTTILGAVYSYEQTGTLTRLFETSEKITLSSRKDFVCITDYGNNKVLAMSYDIVFSATISRPTASAIDYFGNIYVASQNKITVFTRNLEQTGVVYYVGAADELITDIKIDLANITQVKLYALTESGKVYSFTNGTFSPINDISTAIAIDTAPNGMLYILKSDGSVITYSNGELTSLYSKGEFTYIAVDNYGNVYRLASDGIYLNDNASPVYEATNLVSIDINKTELNGKKCLIDYGEIIAISNNSSRCTILPRSEVNTNMLDDPSDPTYIAFLDNIKNTHLLDTALTTDVNPDIRTITETAELYDFPIEMYSDGKGSVKSGDYVIVLDKYTNTDYYYVIAEASSGSFMGFINSQVLSEQKELTQTFDDTECVPIANASIYKYPDANTFIPIVGEAKYGTTYKLLDFVESYTDYSKNVWCRIEYTENNVTGYGYILRSKVSINGITGGDNYAIIPDAVIDADTDTVEIYGDAEGRVVIGYIKNDTPVELVNSFTKSIPYTQIKFISDEERGTVTTCYVKTEYIKMTEASWYQVIFFAVGGAVLIAVIIIIIVVVKKRKKID